MPNEITLSNASPLIPSNFEGAVKLADMMAGANLVPAHLQKKPSDCLMVIEQAARWGMSPFAVAQGTSVIQGKLMYEGKLVAAVANASGILSEKLNYKYEGEGASRFVTVSGKLKGERDVRTVVVKLSDAKTTNQMWTKQPDQQLAYAGARVWSRRHVPELMLGVYAPEEFTAEPIDVTPSVAITPTSGEKTAQQSFGIASGMKAQFAFLIRTIQSAKDDFDLDKITETFKSDFAKFKEMDAESYSQLLEAGRARREELQPPKAYDEETGEVIEEDKKS